MKWTFSWLYVWALIAFAGAMSISSPASAKGTTLDIQVMDVSGTVTSATVVEALDTTGKVMTCELLKLAPGSDSGSFKCDTTGGVPPFLLMEQPPISSPPLYGISETGIGTANINAITGIGTEQTFLALGTSAALQWSSTSPIAITAPMLGSSLGLLDRTFEQPMVAYKFTPQVALTYNYYENKPTPGLINLLKQSALIGIGGTATETAQIALPGSIDFSASITPLPSASGSSSRWTVQASTGISYFSAFGIYPIASNAPAVYTAVGEYYTNFLGLLKHEKSKLDAGNLDIYSPAYFSDGNDALIQSYLDATRLRQLKVSQFSVGTIASLQNGVPDPSSSLIRLNVLRFSTDHGVPCTDECCVSLACTTEGCLDYGNQQIASLGLRYISKSDSSGGSPTILQYLNADGFRANRNALGSHNWRLIGNLSQPDDDSVHTDARYQREAVTQSARLHVAV